MSITELRSAKIYSIAIFDVILGIIGLILLAYTGWLGEYSKDHAIIFGILGVFPIGELFHILFKVNTPVLATFGIQY